MKYFRTPFISLLLFCLFTSHHAKSNSVNVEDSIDLVKVDKSARKMYLIRNGQIVRKYRVSLGDSPKGHKQQEGDERTPEGLYILDYKKEDSSFYRAMHINYPNDQDLAKAAKLGVNPGGQIMIHGQKNNTAPVRTYSKRSDWTNGCIALSNSEMDEFMSLVSSGTPIHIEW